MQPKQRINKFLASGSVLSRRRADEAIAANRVTINGQLAQTGDMVSDTDVITLDGQTITPAVKMTLMLNKPRGYVVSRDGQGSSTIYDLLPSEYQHLQPVGRLDKDTSGLLVLTNDGQLAQSLSHPSRSKVKVYEVSLDKPLTPPDWSELAEKGVKLDDGISKFDELKNMGKNNGTQWTIVMHEGRNRQIRRSFAALGYTVTQLHRTQFGDYSIGTLKSTSYQLM